MGGIRSQDGAQEPWWLISVGRGEGGAGPVPASQGEAAGAAEGELAWVETRAPFDHLSGGRNGEDSQTCWTGVQGGS